MRKIFVMILIFFPVLLFSQNVGVGTVTPSEKLDVNGNINVTGTIKVNGVDGTANQLLMKNSSGVLSWNNMPYPASASDTSVNFLPRTIRNLYVTDSNISITVQETGKYLVFFYGGMINYNETFGTETAYDVDGTVRVFNSTSSSEIFSATAISFYFDLYTPNATKRKYVILMPSRTIMANLSANDVLRLQYRQQAFGTPLPATSWYMGNGGITILKIGN